MNNKERNAKGKIKPQQKNVKKKESDEEAQEISQQELEEQIKVQKKNNDKVDQKKQKIIGAQEKVEQQKQEQEQGLGQEQQDFLDQIFIDLENERLNYKYPMIKIGTHFKDFKTIPIQKLQENITISQSYNISGNQQNNKIKRVYCYEESCPLTERHGNGFFKAFYEAYINHGDIKITPDDVWVTIMLYFTKYVDNHAVSLWPALVKHNEKQQLVVRTVCADEQKWDEFFDKIIIEIQKNTVKNVTLRLRSSSKILSTAIIMNTFKKYFNYTRIGVECGIQNAHMGGNEQDWKRLIKKMQHLQTFDVDGMLKLYITRLKPILEQFLETYRGKASLKFWNNIYHDRENPDAIEYQPKLYINGWIIRFFTLAKQLPDAVSVEGIDVPIKFVNEITNVTKQLNLYGGCNGISVEKNVFRPCFSFAIVQNEKQQKVQSQG